MKVFNLALATVFLLSFTACFSPSNNSNDSGSGGVVDSNSSSNGSQSESNVIINPDPQPAPQPQDNSSGSNSVPDSVPAPSAACFTKTFTQPDAVISKSVDILFVTDTSGSMYDKHEKLSAQIQAFINQLPSDSDYRIAAILGHSPSSTYHGKLFSPNGYPKVLSSQNMFIDHADNSRSIKWNLRNMLINAPSDWRADGGELGLLSFKSAITTNLAYNKSLGFFRDNAALSVIFVSDENDICATIPKGVTRVRDLDYYQGQALEIWSQKQYCGNVTPEIVYNEAKKLKGEVPLMFNGLVYNDAKSVPVSTRNNQIEDELGYGFLELISLSHGISTNIGQGSYVTGLRQMGDLTYRKLNLFNEVQFSESDIDINTFKVFVDKEQSTYTWNAETKVMFLPQPGDALSKVEVDYCLIAQNPPPSGGNTGGTTDPNGGSSGGSTTPPSGGSSGGTTDPNGGSSGGSTTPPSGGSSGGTTDPTGGTTTPPVDQNTIPHDVALNQFATIGFDAAMSVDTAYLIWQTDSLSTSRVVYGTVSSLGSTTVEDVTMTNSHSVTISGLQSKTTYYFQSVSVNPAGLVSYGPVIMKTTK